MLLPRLKKKMEKIFTVPKEFAFLEVTRERLSHNVGTKISGIDSATKKSYGRLIYSCLWKPLTSQLNRSLPEEMRLR